MAEDSEIEERREWSVMEVPMPMRGPSIASCCCCCCCVVIVAVIYIYRYNEIHTHQTPEYTQIYMKINKYKKT